MQHGYKNCENLPSSNELRCVFACQCCNCEYECFAMTGFALHPFEALWTFCPILLISSPTLGLYAPIHLPFLAFFAFLNLYLHCGYAIPALEFVFSNCYINTSVWHNKHHEVSIAHFGEMLTLWDLVFDTHSEAWTKKQYANAAANVSTE